MRPIGVDLDQYTAAIYGFAVERAAANLPQTTASAIYNVNVGAIFVVALVGRVTTIIQNQANNTKITATPTAGTAVDLSAVVDIANLEVGGHLTLPAAFGTALTKSLAGAALLTNAGCIVEKGTIKLDCAASNTGQIKWTLYYLPFDIGAYVTAA